MNLFIAKNSWQNKLTQERLLIFVLLGAYISGGITFGSFYMFHLLVGVLGLSFLFLYKNTPLFFWDIRQFLWLGWFSINVATITWSWHLGYSIQTISILVIGSLVYFVASVVAADNKSVQVLIKVLTWVVLFEIVISLIEIFTSFRWPLESGLNMRFASTIVPTGFRGNPNNLTTVLILTMPFVFSSKHKPLRVLVLLSIIGVVFFANSRGNLLVALGYITYLFLFRIKWSQRFKIILVLLFLVLVIILSYPEFVETIANQFGLYIGIFLLYISGGISVDNSVSTRISLLNDSFSTFLQHPYGIGLGASRVLFEQRGYKITSLHNFWIEMLLEGGILSLLIFVLIVALCCIGLWRTSYIFLTGFRRSINITLIESIILMIPSIVSLSTGYYFLPLYLLLGISTGIIILGKNDKKTYFQ